MSNDKTGLLKKVIDIQHGGESAYLHSVRVHRAPAQPGVWDGVVHVFSIVGNALADKAYAWAAPIDGSTSSNFFAVLHNGPVRSPRDAVDAVVKAIRAAA